MLRVPQWWIFKKGGEGEIHRYFCIQLIDNVTISHNIR